LIYTSLVVVDSRLPADAACQMLNLLGLEAQPAYGARQAIHKLKEAVPDIIFY
jgi:hypothetical protein